MTTQFPSWPTPESYVPRQTHGGGWIVKHDIDCPLLPLVWLRDAYSHALGVSPAHPPIYSALGAVLRGALDQDADDQAPKLWCHYCGAPAVGNAEDNNEE